jgi:hypothetical protein
MDATLIPMMITWTNETESEPTLFVDSTGQESYGLRPQMIRATS